MPSSTKHDYQPTRKRSNQLPATATRWPEWQPQVYWVVSVVLFLIPLAITTFIPHDQRRLRMPDPWGYEVATHKFSQGNWSLTNEQVTQARSDVRLRGGSLDQYVPISEDQWVFRQSPGYPLMLAPFYRLGIPRIATLLLALGAFFILHRLLLRWYDAQIALTGTVLLAWSPITLLAFHYLYMDTYASGVLLLISGGILLWYESQQHNSHFTWLIIFIAGASGGWAVVVRNVNVLPLAVLIGYFFLIWRQRRQQNYKQVWPELLIFTLGLALGISGLLLYNFVTFGQFISTGYAYPSPDDPMFLWKGDPVTVLPSGMKTWVAEGTIGAIIRAVLDHILLWIKPATLGWPFLPLVPISLVGAIWHKRFTQRTAFLWLWILAVYAFYAGIVFFGVTRILTVPANQLWGFFAGTRYLFPATLPFVLLTVDQLTRWPRKWVFIFTIGYMFVGGWIFWQVLLHS